MIGLFIAKLPIAVKLLTVAAVAYTAAFASGLPVNDIWFDAVLFMVVSSIVGGEPEPDLDLPLRKFLYLWFYRSTHLFVSTATAYFIHKNKWPEISGNKEQPCDEETTSVEVKEIRKGPTTK
jgi:hypothetical protein